MFAQTTVPDIRSFAGAYSSNNRVKPLSKLQLHDPVGEVGKQAIDAQLGNAEANEVIERCKPGRQLIHPEGIGVYGQSGRVGHRDQAG